MTFSPAFFRKLCFFGFLPLALHIFCLHFHLEFSEPRGKGVDEGISFRTEYKEFSYSPHTMSVGLCIFSLLLRKEGSLIMAEQDTDPRF